MLVCAVFAIMERIFQCIQKANWCVMWDCLLFALCLHLTADSKLWFMSTSATEMFRLSRKRKLQQHLWLEWNERHSDKHGLGVGPWPSILAGHWVKVSVFSWGNRSLTWMISILSSLLRLCKHLPGRDQVKLRYRNDCARSRCSHSTFLWQYLCF